MAGRPLRFLLRIWSIRTGTERVVASLRVVDPRGRELDFRSVPRRVVSLVPSDTLNVAALGCGGALVGRTDYCELPEDVVRGLPSIGGTKNPRIDDVCALRPDLVLANQEENTRGDLEELARRGVRVYIAFPKRVIEGLAHLARLARIFHVERDAGVRDLVARGYHALRAADEARSGAAPVRTFCPIWMDPLMTIHGDTFISDMLDLCGAQNVFADRERRYPLAADLGKASPLPREKVGDRDVRYPRVTLEEVVARVPELVLLPDEPHPFSEEDAAVFGALDIPAVEMGAVVRIAGKDLCWPGARSVDGIARVRELVSHYAR
jgi:ABC-type Fe3+-hydroxamate transport system substrate-binding protein